ncbi:MAG: quinone-dependent dihydroorotate dehydrogenase [Candidatus Puniceispirillaceae bacterium]
MWQVATSLTQKLPAEIAHNVAVKALSWGMGPKADVPFMPVRLAGLTLPNPLGLAAGFDKNAEAFDGAFRLGFGFVEVGTITPLPQPGNARPRVFRLSEDEGVINRYGFNGKGMEAAAKRLGARSVPETIKTPPILGVNIGANKLTIDKPADYYKSAARLGGLADYVTVNISSPNTPGLRDLQDAEALKVTLQATFDGLHQAGHDKPVFVKLAPDLTKTALWQSLEAASAFPVNGFILTNTTITRPDTLQSRHRAEQGGLSGRPVASLSEASLIDALAFRKAHGSSTAIISVGGIFDACDVFVRLALGADATQLYSALSLKGPYLPARILTDLGHMVAKATGQGSPQHISSLCGSITDLQEARHLARSLV